MTPSTPYFRGRRPWLLLAGLLALWLAACGNGDEDQVRPTELRVVTGEPTQVALLSTIDAQQTQLAVVANTAVATALRPFTPSPSITATPQVVGEGQVTTQEALMLTEPSETAAELRVLEAGNVVEILSETAPNRIGVVYYQVRFEGEVGWVASTQIRLNADTAPEVAVLITPPTQTSSPTATITTTPTITPTPLPEGFPTPEIFAVVLVEQVFEGGRAFWFEPTQQIWVLRGEEGEIDPTSGTWQCYEDTFVEGQTERDDALDPPSGTVTESQFSNASPQQPVRGFGKVWRENPDVREALGWALIPETRFNSRYQYVFGGEMVEGEYEPEPGTYELDSLFQQTIRFTEDDIRQPCENLSGTWEVVETP
ncbi:MAG: SH3 domain-containing protein [Anaerolineae bacterium]|nr:SH3 domain-containing protein [Anaerolineae bacterium]